MDSRPSRTFKCEFCGQPVVTRNAAKRYCTKRCADRARTRAAYAYPASDLRQFGRLPLEEKQAILNGETAYTVVIYDLECTHLNANVGRILCCSFKPLGQPVYTFSALDRRFRRADVYDDGALAVAIRDELVKYDVIVGHNSKAFDTKYLNARLLRIGEATKPAQYQIDSMWAWASKARAWKGLASIQQFLGTPTEKTSIEWSQWMRALGWDKDLREAAMAEIVDHCERDVTALEEVYRMLVKADAIRGLRRDGGIL